MSKKLLEVLPSLQSFKDNVINQLVNMFTGAEWLDDTTSYTKQETIYRLLILKYGDRIVRYDDDSIFLNRLVFDLADLLPDIYAKQQVFIKNKLNEFLSDNKNRAVIIDIETTNNRNSDSNSKLGNSSSPLNLVIDNAAEIQQAPITSSNLSNVKLVENYNGNNQQINYNFVNDLVKTLNADYSLRLNEFMVLLGKHFVNVVGSYYRTSNCNNPTVKDEMYRFNNGYLVNEVDYLCTENKNEIDRFNKKLEDLNNAVMTKQDRLIEGENIRIVNNEISAIIPNLSKYATNESVDTKIEIVNDKLATKVEVSDYNTRNKFIDETFLKIDGSISKINSDLKNINDEVAKKQNIINDILNVYEGEIKVFRTKTLALNFVNFWGLKENIDYVVGINGSYVVIGENGNVGGSNLIKLSDFPSFKFSVTNEYGSPLQMTEAGSGLPVASLLPYSGVGKNNRNVFIQNVNNAQTEFKPKYSEVFAVVFLKKLFIIK